MNNQPAGIPRYLLLALLLAAPAGAAELSGTKTIRLGGPNGERQEIGTVAFTPLGNGKSSFTIVMDPRLEEYFLAMRPFRCLTGPRQRLCHFGVAREAPEVSNDDLVPLEYALMFMRTAPNSLHVNPFNGLIYKLQPTASGLRGALFEVDMDPFITPDSVPPERRRRPLRAADLSPADPAAHWLPEMTIE